jgi:hypothetical protein
MRWTVQRASHIHVVAVIGRVPGTLHHTYSLSYCHLVTRTASSTQTYQKMAGSYSLLVNILHTGSCDRTPRDPQTCAHGSQQIIRSLKAACCYE